MKRLILLGMMCSLLAIGACDSGVTGDQEDSVAGVASKKPEDRGAVKYSFDWPFEFYFDDWVEELKDSGLTEEEALEQAAAYFDIDIPCLGGLVRGQGLMYLIVDVIETPGGNRRIENFRVDYEKSDMWWDYVDEFGGGRSTDVEPHDWVMIKGNQRNHDVYIPGIDVFKVHQFSMHEWYENTVTGEIQVMNYPFVAHYDLNGDEPELVRYMDNGWCPGQSL